MKKLFLLFLTTALFCINAGADQLAYITKEQAEKAAALLKNEKEVMLFCGCCDNVPKIIVNIKSVYISPAGYEDYYEVIIEGYTGENQIRKAIDLAYVFINKKGMASPVCSELGFDCDPCVENLTWGVYQIKD